MGRIRSDIGKPLPHRARKRDFVMLITSETQCRRHSQPASIEQFPFVLMTDINSPSRVPLLGPNEPHAPIAILTTAKRAALVACLRDGSLHKHGGVWTAPSATSDEKPIAGPTVADLGRDGLLALTVLGRSKSAQLTQRGNWFARTLADRALELYRATSI